MLHRCGAAERRRIEPPPLSTALRTTLSPLYRRATHSSHRDEPIKMTTRTGSTPVNLDEIPAPVPFIACVGGAVLQIAGLLGVWSRTSAGACLAAPTVCVTSEDSDPWGRLVVGAITVAAAIWALSLRTGTHSDASIVDRLWSIQPVIYCWYACYMFPTSPRLWLMTALSSRARPG